MKPFKNPKFGKFLLIALLVFAFAIFGLAWLPAKIEGNYGYSSACMCGGKSILRFENGKVILYNTEHPPGTLFADYLPIGDGAVKVIRLPEFRDEGQSEDDSSFIVIPRALFLRVPKQDTFREDGFEIRLPSIGNIGTTIDTHSISRTLERENGVLVEEIYDKELKFLRSKVIPHRPIITH